MNEQTQSAAARYAILIHVCRVDDAGQSLETLGEFGPWRASTDLDGVLEVAQRIEDESTGIFEALIAKETITPLFLGDDDEDEEQAPAEPETYNVTFHMDCEPGDNVTAILAALKDVAGIYSVFTVNHEYYLIGITVSGEQGTRDAYRTVAAAIAKVRGYGLMTP